MTEYMCRTCKHEGTDHNVFCKGATSTVCCDYEIHATKAEVAVLRAEIARLRKAIKVKP